MADPLLIDQLVAQGKKMAGGPVPDRLWNTVVKARMNSERFIFSPEASNLIGSFTFNDGDLILENRQFAIPPYDNCYIEIDATEFFRHAKEDITPNDERDKKLGYLVVNGHDVYVLFGRDKQCGIAYWRYHIMPPGQKSRPNQLEVNLHDFAVGFKRWLLDNPKIKESLLTRLGMSEDDLRSTNYEHKIYQEAFRLNMYLGGSTPINTPKQYKEALEILDEVSTEWLVPDGHPIRDKRITTHMFQRFYGDIRNFWAMVLWLHNRQRVHMLGVPAGRKIVRGKLMPYLRYNVVNINLGGHKVVRRAFNLASERESPCGHDVVGHWAHRGGKRACISMEGHDWPLMADGEGHFICKNCGLKRWWRKKHTRGDSSRGWSVKHYEVDAA